MMNTLFASLMIFNIFFSVFPPVNADSNTIDCQPHYIEGFYLPAWVTNDTWYREMPQHTVGKAVWYAPWLMNATAEYRGMNLKGFLGGVATNSAGMMGKVVWLKREGLTWEGPYLVVDTGQRNHAYHQAINVKTIVEVDFNTAIRWGIVSYNKNEKKGYQINRWYEPAVEMWVGLESPSVEAENAVQTVVYSEWYEKNAEFCDGEPNRRWKLEDWMIKDYEEYVSKLNESGVQEEVQTAFPIRLPVISAERAKLIQKLRSKLLALQEPKEETQILTTHILQDHETWTHLSLKYYGHTTEPYWRLIYEANQDMVGDDYHRIWGGMEVVIPILPLELAP